jgi:hypothetical protein
MVLEEDMGSARRILADAGIANEISES